MAVGEGNNEAVFSYLAFGRETTFGTGVTTTANLPYLSSGMKITQGNKILEEISRSRVFSKNIKTGKTIEGSIESYFYPENTACAWIIQNVMGGAIVSATATGETAGGLAFQHTTDIGNILNQTYSALTINTRKGDSSTGKVFEYTGNRASEYSLGFEIDDAVKFSSSYMGKDFTSAGTDVESLITSTALECLSFVDGRISLETSVAALTTTSFWHVQNGSLTITNSLKSGNESRRIGSDTLQVLPPGMATLGLTLGLRFDTITAIQAMRNNTQFMCELNFEGSTIGTSVIKRGLKLQAYNLRVEEASDPEIGGPDEQILSEVTFSLLHDNSSATGFSLRSIITNAVANYN